MTESSSAPLWHPDLKDINLVELLRALADPTRLEMVRRLLAAPGELSCAEFACGTKQLATHHLRILREAGITVMRDQGRQRFTRLRREILDAHFPQLLALVGEAREPAAPSA